MRSVALLVVVVGVFHPAAALQMSLYRRVEALWLRPLYAVEQHVAGKQIPALATAPAPLRRLDDPAAVAGATFDHAAWDALLARHVSDDGRVDYDGLRADRAPFDGYVAALAAVDVGALAGREQLALHLNAYNAFCVKHVLDAPRDLASILDLSSKDAPIWDARAGELGGAAVSLNDIEHRRLRLVWDAPELHACIVCASTSCPSLAPFAFKAATLEDDMRARAAAWLNDATKGCALDGGGAARLSRIFLWFEDDFRSRGGAANFAADFAADAATARALREAPALRYFAYDWGLNKK